ESAVKLSPYLALADRLGKFIAQVEPKLTPKSIEIECMGEPAELGMKPIAASAVAGFLHRWLDAPVNHVSARPVAMDRGIVVRELRTAVPRGKYASLVVVRITTADDSVRVAAGTLGSDGSARLVKWGDFEIEAHLGGPTLVVTNIDKPGVVGFIGTTLGDAAVNIARVHLGVAAAGRAVSVW